MNEQDIPIIISAEKLQDFLLTRRIVNKNWQNSIRPIRDGIAQAVNDMPEHEELVKLLSGSHINYFHCLQILEILKKTEADTKNLFGRYSSQRYTSWQDIIKSYERDSIYLAESAQIFYRNVAYEIPGLKKQIAHLEKLEEESHKKISDLNRSETMLRNEYNAICEQFNVKSDNIRECLIKNITELPQMQNKVAKCVPSLSKAVALYSSFANNTDVLPLIRHIAANGNTTVYQYIYGEAPLSVEEPPHKIEIDPENAADEYDFGDGIDFNTGEEINLEVGDIDWGDGNDGEAAAPAEPIDFNISLEESGIVVEQTGCSGGVAKGDEAYTLLDSPKHREQFVDELYELEAFLKLRLYELSASDGKHQIMTIGSVSTFADHDVKTIVEMLSNVEVAISNATDETLYHLHQIKHSPNYVNILTGKLKQRLQSIDKVERMREALKVKIEQYHQEAIELRPKLKKLVEVTQVLQQQIQNDISKRYKNRVVDITGVNYSIK